MSQGSSLNWAGILVTAVIGGVAGFASARLQDWLRRRERFRSIARVLQAAADRVRRELGEPSDRYIETNAYGTTRAPPTLHRWTERLVAESGDLSSSLAADFLALDTQLNNFGVYLDKLRETHAKIAPLKEQLRDAEREGPNGAVRTVSIRRWIEELQPAATFAHDRLVESRREAVKCLDSIDGALEPYV